MTMSYTEPIRMQCPRITMDKRNIELAGVTVEVVACKDEVCLRVPSAVHSLLKLANATSRGEGQGETGRFGPWCLMLSLLFLGLKTEKQLHFSRVVQLERNDRMVERLARCL